MASMSSDPPPCVADDWFVVSNDDNSHGFSLEGSSPNKCSKFSGVRTQYQSLETQERKSKPIDFDTTQMDSTSSQTRRLEHYKVLIWYNGLETPIKLLDEDQEAIIVAVEGYLTQEMVRELVLGQPLLCQTFSHVTPRNLHERIQVCERLNDEMKWVHLRTQKEVGPDVVKGSILQLTSQSDHSNEKRYRQLLVESKFEAGRNKELTDWRCGRYYSDILENAWRFELRIGQLIDALDTDKRWFESRIVDTGAVYVKVHYRGWTNQWDEWLRRTSSRLAPLHTKVPNWRAFRVNDEILVGFEASGKSHPEWRCARVTACAVEDDSLQIEVDVDGKKKWMDAQDELLCQKGTHKPINTSAKRELPLPHTLLANYFERPQELTPSQEPHVDELESVRRSAQAMQITHSVVDSDEWCVVYGEDDDCVFGENDMKRAECRAESDAVIGPKAFVLKKSEDVKGDATSIIKPLSPKTIYDRHSAANVNNRLTVTTKEDNRWRLELQVGQLIDACDTDNKWYESRVVALRSKSVKVHYRGWTSIWDEWIEYVSPRIAPLHTKVRNWRAFKAGDGVMVGRQVAKKKCPEWRNAIVTGCIDVDKSLRIEVDTGGCSIWMDAQDELLCPLGTHKAVNSSFHVAPLF